MTTPTTSAWRRRDTPDGRNSIQHTNGWVVTEFQRGHITLYEVYSPATEVNGQMQWRGEFTGGTAAKEFAEREGRTE